MLVCLRHIGYVHMSCLVASLWCLDYDPGHKYTWRTPLCLQVLEGELAQRAEATRKLREVQKQLMLLGGLVPPSPVVTAAAAAAARGRRNSSNLASSAGGGSSCGGGLHEEAALMQEAKRLQDAIDGHTRSVKVCQCVCVASSCACVDVLCACKLLCHGTARAWLVSSPFRVQQP